MYPSLGERAIYVFNLEKQLKDVNYRLNKIQDNNYNHDVQDDSDIVGDLNNNIFRLHQLKQILEKELHIFKLMEEVLILKNDYGQSYDNNDRPTFDFSDDVDVDRNDSIAFEEMLGKDGYKKWTEGQ